jgi:hypothetical protein
MRIRRKARRGAGPGWAGGLRFWGYLLGRMLQVIGLLVTLVAATAFFGTPSTTAMLRLMLVGVVCFVPGWGLTRHDPRQPR